MMPSQPRAPRHMPSLLNPRRSPQVTLHNNSPLAGFNGHFYFARLRTFLLCFDTGALPYPSPRGAPGAGLSVAPELVATDVPMPSVPLA
jgi:hypothetical protein